jgi:hypothetical protein
MRKSSLPQFPFAPRCRLAGRRKLRVSVLQILGGQASQVGGRALGRPRALLQFAWGSEGRKKVQQLTIVSLTPPSYLDPFGRRSTKRPEVEATKMILTKVRRLVTNVDLSQISDFIVPVPYGLTYEHLSHS